MAKRQDRRVQRTQQLLREALFALIREKGFEALSVQHIIDRANVGRATFYAHFENKEDLLMSGFDVLRASLRARQREALSGGGTINDRVFAFSRDMLVHVDQHRSLFRAMTGKRSGTAVQNVLRKLVVDLVRADVTAMCDRSRACAAVDDAAVEFVAGGLFGMMMWWLGGKAQVSIEEVNASFRRFAIAATKATVVGQDSPKT